MSYFYYMESQLDQLAKQQATIHKAVIQILEGKGDRIPLLDPNNICKKQGRCYLNPKHPFYTLIAAYQDFDTYLFHQLFNNVQSCQQNNKVKLLSPYCQLLLQCDVFINIREAIALTTESNNLLSISLSALEEVYWLLGALMMESVVPAFRSAVSQYNHKVGYTDNLREYSHYIRNLFNTYSRLLVIRVDLGYKQDMLVIYEQFRTDVDSLLKNISTHSVFEDLAGYIWKLEHGNDKGYHIHLLLLYDGAKRWSDYYIALQVGEFWQNNITLGRGLYFNCNTLEQKNNYPNSYLGAVHRNEQQKIDWIIEWGVKYLLKTDEYLRFTKPDNRRILGRGIMPR